MTNADGLHPVFNTPPVAATRILPVTLGAVLLLTSIVQGPPAQAAVPSLINSPAMPNATRPGVAVTPDGSRLYTTNFSAAQVYSTNLATNSTTTISLPGVLTTSGIEMSSSGVAYITDYDSDRLLFFNTATNQIDDSISVGDAPRNSALSPDQTRLYVVNFGSDSLSVVDTSTRSVVATVPVGDGPFDVATSTDGTSVYVTNKNTNTISVVSTANNTVSRTISLSGYVSIESLAVSPLDDTLYITSFSHLVSVDASSGTSSAVSLASPRSLVVSADGYRVFVAVDGFFGSPTLRAFDGVTGAAVATLAPTFQVQSLALSPDGRTLYGPGQANFQRADTGLRTVTFHANGGTGSLTPQRGYSSTPLSPNSFTRAGYGFVGWNTVSGGGGTPYQNQGLYSFSADDTLYAQWIPATQPGAPTITGVTPSGTTAAVAFTADDTGGDTITRLEFALDDTITVDDSTTNIASPKTLSGLTMSTNYTVYMRAVNSQGAGPWSAPASFRTQGRPGTPVVSGVTPDLTSVSVAFTADDSGGSTILQIQYALDDTNSLYGSSTNVSPVTVAGLTSGTSYALYVRAVNSWGPSAWSAATPFTTLTPLPPPPPPAPLAPSAPIDVRATAGDASLRASWSAPAAPGDFTVTNYQATASPSGRSCMTTSTACTIDGLTNGTSYTVTVRALSGAGWSVASTPSEAVVPRADESTSLTIAGSRGSGAERSMIRVRGTSTGLAGERVTLWLAMGDRKATPASAMVQIRADGTFTWSRKLTRAVVIYAEAGGVRSNAIRLPAAR